ncbi:lipocalin-like domain-containing protein [Devosia sp. CN2-171]|uniref:lipocalin-like domain-containing protein n=1 Tax=Devosia sp. CN2-171 TaxID=3400909 RepID=UPI003BF7993E
MTKLHVALAMAAAMAVATPAFAQDDSLKLLSGAWRMTSLEVGNAAGELEPIEYSGQIVFTDAGTMSVQAMNPDADAAATPYTANGYEAFYGTVTIDEAAKTFVVTVESSLARTMIGQGFERAFQVSEDQLVLTPTNPEESWRVTYERQ